ncbi:LysR family transcriptional regulator [Pantoea stewartii]|uniref:LysR family transcriptional regulator n=1 Tax=Pantoea stewartii TaxID=66269 RepID=UPI00162A8C77|nr:LysR family transcriptional regulator [Pantoea stewartii]MBC0856528.1 LysR family transcriptional regulator [Pantoea stewartii]
MNFDGFDLNLLVAFNALMLERNVTRAAALAQVSQPAMSAALSRLRKMFDDPLFIRSAEGLLPTAKAQDMAVSVSEALHQVKRLINPTQHFSPEVHKNHYMIGMSEYPIHVVLPNLTRKFSKLAPQSVMHIRSFSDKDESVALLDAGKIDIAVGVAPSKAESRIFSMPVLEDQFVTLVGRDNPAARKGMSKEIFLEMEHILFSPEGNHYGLMDEKLREENLTRRIGLTIPSMFALPALLTGTEYVATALRRVINSSINQGDLIAFQPPVDMPSVQFHLLWHKRSDVNPANIWMRELISQICLAIK